MWLGQEGQFYMKASAGTLQIRPNGYVWTGETLVRGKEDFIEMPPDLWIFDSQAVFSPCTVPSTLDIQELARVME